MLAPFDRKLIFPPKANMKPVIKAAKVQLVSNHFPVTFTNPNFKAHEWTLVVIHQADVSAAKLNPDVPVESAVDPGNRVRIDLALKDCQREIDLKFGPNFASGSSLYCFKQLDTDQVVVSGRGRFGLVFRRTPNSPSLADLIPAETSRYKVLQLLNNQVKSVFRSMGYLELGFNRRYYNLGLTESFNFDGTKYSVLKGFGAVFESYDSGLKLQLEYATRVICEENLWARIKREKQASQDINRFLGESVIGRSFMTVYGNQKLVIIDDVDVTKTPLSPFPNPKFKNYVDYFKQTYGETVKDTSQFLLVQSIKRKSVDEDGKVQFRVEKIHYLPEFLRAEGIPEKLKKDFKFMKEVCSRAILPTDVRFQRTYDMADQINKSKASAIDFKVEVGKNQVDGYSFEPPKIMHEEGHGSVPKNDQLRVNRLAEKTAINRWVLLYDKFQADYVKCVLNNLDKVAQNLKFSLKAPTQQICVSDRADLGKLVAQLGSGPDTPQIVLVFVNRRTATGLYKEFKRRCHAAGILTQFFVNFNPNRDAESSPKYHNIILQMQAKLGNNLWLIDHALSDTLVLGADVYHSRNGRSVASLVGQFGKHLRHTYSETCIQSSQYEEIIGSMSAMFLKILEQYHRVEKKLPARVIFYRDGVGQSFIERTLEQEVGGIIEAMEKKFALKRPKITVVLVTKRISDKFATRHGHPGNPLPGTVVESGVVEPGRASFFMIAQKVTQGTANPTKYQVVYDENETRFEDLIRLTHNLCWGYFNWMGPVKVPAPVQYAHKNCYLLGELQDAKVRQELKSLMYYL